MLGDAESEFEIAQFGVGPRKRSVYLMPADLERARSWEAAGFT